MPTAEGRPLDAVLPTGAGGPGRPGADASDGRALYEVAVLRGAADGGGAAPGWRDGKPQARAPADAGDGRGWPKVPAAKPLEGPDEGWRRSTRSPTPARGTRITRFIRICCAAWLLSGRTKCGAPI